MHSSAQLLLIIENEWYLDSGATDNMWNRRNYFNLSIEPTLVTIGGGSCSNAVCEGNAFIKAFDTE